jgi:hypothetical protein
MVVAVAGRVKAVAKRPSRKPKAEKPEASVAEGSSSATEHPRRVNPVNRRYEDKQLRPDRTRGGFDTK